MLEINKIYNMECSEGMKLLDTESVDLIIGSPPYDKLRTYNNFDLDLHKIGQETFRVLKNGGIFCLVIQDGTENFGKSCTTARTIVDYVDNIGFKLFENVIFNRHGRSGAWWNKRFRVDHEYILIFLKGKRPQHFNKEPLKIPSIHAGETFHGTQRYSDGSLRPITKKVQNTLKCRGTVWTYNGSSTEDNRDKTKFLHPATFPDKLANDLIVCFSDEGMLVLDPFMGSGTTALEARKLCRNYIGFDISEEYCLLAQTRLEKTWKKS